MNYTNHSSERLMLRYGLESSNYLTNLLTTNYSVNNTDIVGSETREAIIKYVVKDNNILTFLPAPDPIDSFFYTLVNLRKDIIVKDRKINGYKKSISNKDKILQQINKNKEERDKQVGNLKRKAVSMEEYTSQLERQLKESKQYAKALKKKLDNIDKPKGTVEVTIPKEIN